MKNMHKHSPGSLAGAEVEKAVWAKTSKTIPVAAGPRKIAIISE